MKHVYKLINQVVEHIDIKSEWFMHGVLRLPVSDMLC